MLSTGRNNLVPWVLFVLALRFNTAASFAQQLTESLPVVTAASVPLYPPLARQAHIEGEVRLEISTDGDRISNVDIVSGQPMLAQATKENVNTWRFRPHTRTKFVVTFRYRLLSVPEESRCSATNANSNVVLKMPKEVDVSVNEAWVCDPATPVR